MQKGADLEKSKNQFGTALHVACLRGYMERVRILLNSGASAYAIKRHQATLHTAALCRYEDCTSLIIDYGANLHSTVLARGVQYSIYPRVGRCGATPHTLTLFKTNIADFPTLFKTEFRFLIPCLRHLTRNQVNIN